MKKSMYATPDHLDGDDIRYLRQRLQLTQGQLADFLQVSKATVVHWENSGKPITGPVILAVKMLREHPEMVRRLTIPEQEMPIRLYYYYRNELCTIIDVSDPDMEVRIYNYTRWLQNRAFGVNTEPTYEDYQSFLESRCFPRTRDKIKIELRSLGLPFYDPFLIVEKTQGRMEGDDFWIQVVRKNA